MQRAEKAERTAREVKQENKTIRVRYCVASKTAAVHRCSAALMLQLVCLQRQLHEERDNRAKAESSYYTMLTLTVVSCSVSALLCAAMLRQQQQGS